MLCYPFRYLSLLLQPVQIPGLFVIARQHPVKILDQISGRHGLLIHIIGGAIDLPLLYRFEIFQNIAFADQLIHRGHASVNGTVVDQDVCVFRSGIKIFDLHIQRRSSCYTLKSLHPAPHHKNPPAAD